MLKQTCVKHDGLSSTEHNFQWLTKCHRFPSNFSEQVLRRTSPKNPSNLRCYPKRGSSNTNPVWSLTGNLLSPRDLLKPVLGPQVDSSTSNGGNRLGVEKVSLKINTTQSIESKRGTSRKEYRTFQNLGIDGREESFDIFLFNKLRSESNESGWKNGTSSRWGLLKNDRLLKKWKKETILRERTLLSAVMRANLRNFRKQSRVAGFWCFVIACRLTSLFDVSGIPVGMVVKQLYIVGIGID